MADRYGPYQVVAELARSRHGAVYRAVGPRGEVVALKTIDPAFAAKGPDRERFLRGAKAASRVQSPHLVRIHDVGHAVETGHYWCAMDFVEGTTLASRLQRGPLPRQDVISIGAQAAQALSSLHRCGVVHRNVKPAHLILDNITQPRVTLVGMGLVKMADEITNNEVTARGAVVGTPAYLAPEALSDSSNVDTSADLYSLGVVMYEALTGRLPYTQRSVMDLLVAKIEVPPDFTGFDPAMSRLLGRLLTADPSKRPRDAAEIVRALSD